MIMGVKTYGFSDKQKALASAVAASAELLPKYANTMAAELVAIAKKNTPVGETGDLRQGWSMDRAQTSLSGEAKARVYNNTEYGPHVEYGHRVIIDGKVRGYVEGQYFFNKSKNQFRQAKRAIERDLQRELAKRLGS